MRAELPGHLPAGVRVVREAPTYLLCALEYGEASLAALARRDAAAEAVAKRRRSACARGSPRSFASTPRRSVNAAAARSASSTSLLAAARFTRRYDCTPASDLRGADAGVSSRRVFCRWKRSSVAAGRQFVPIDLELHDVAVLTGPNMGGKSVCAADVRFHRTLRRVRPSGSGGCRANGALRSNRLARLGPRDADRRPALLVRARGLGAQGDLARGGAAIADFGRRVCANDDAARGEGAADRPARTAARAAEPAACSRRTWPGIAGAAGARHFAVRGLRGDPAAAAVGGRRRSASRRLPARWITRSPK